MQKIVFLLLLIFSGIPAFSQQEFFIYFQAENHQPFYARIKQKIYSSSESGYMIIPKLGDSTYQIVLGFPKNVFPEQRFSVSINKKDKGFQLKNQGDKGWTLVNLQNMSVILNEGISSKQVTEMSGVKKTDAFSALLANVVNDSAILYSAVRTKPPETVSLNSIPETSKLPEQKEQEKQALNTTDPTGQSENKPLVKQEDSIAKPKKEVTEIVASLKETPVQTINENTGSTPKDPVIKKDSAKILAEKPFIIKIEETKTENSYQATYLEQYNFSTDTIIISIGLNENLPVVLPAVKPAVENKNELGSEQKTVSDDKVPSNKPVVIDSVAAGTHNIIITNSDCKNFATDYDVDKLRIKLISDKTIDDKLATTKKSFKAKCFSVKQIKALTELYPSDETRYRFFDIAYPFISDTGNFYLLEELIENDYYKNRFKAMILK